MSDFLDKMIADLKEGAERSEGFMRGGRVGVEVARERRGREEKLAGFGGGLGGAIGPLGAAVGAGLQDGDAGSAAGGALGSLAGGVLGAPVGALGGALVGVPIGALVNLIRGKDVGDGATLGAAVGGTAGGLAGAPLGSIVGGHLGQNRFRDDDDKPKTKKRAALEAHYADGAKAAADHFKVAFLPMLGSLAGGALLRGGLGMAAKRFGGNALGRAAGGVMNWAGKSGLRGNALDMAGSMAGGAIGSQLQGPQG